MRRLTFSIGCSVLLVGLTATTQASPIRYSWSAIGTGVLNTQAFADAEFTIVATADTDDVVQPPGAWTVANVFASVSVDGAGADVFSGEIRVTNNLSLRRVGTGDDSNNSAVLFVDNDVFVGYDLKGPFGPVVGPPAFSSGVTFDTTAGEFSITDVSTVTFVAVLIPEPTTLALVAIGLMCIGTKRCRR